MPSFGAARFLVALNFDGQNPALASDTGVRTRHAERAMPSLRLRLVRLDRESNEGRRVDERAIRER
jgi:hypothetical protein